MTIAYPVKVGSDWGFSDHRLYDASLLHIAECRSAEMAQEMADALNRLVALEEAMRDLTSFEYNFHQGEGVTHQSRLTKCMCRECIDKRVADAMYEPATDSPQ